MLKRKEREILEDIARERTPAKERYNLEELEFCQILKKLSEHKYIRGVHFVTLENETSELVFMDLDVTAKGEDALGFFE